MRTDIDYAFSKNSVYIKNNEQIYELNGISKDCFTKVWNEIKEENFKIEEKNIIKKRIIGFLNDINAFETNKNTSDLLSIKNLNVRKKFIEDYVIGICGDNDLAEMYTEKCSFENIVNLNKYKTSTYDIGLIVLRKFNRKSIKNTNQKMFENSIPYNSITFDNFSFEMNYTIPKETSCLNCKMIREEDNNFYGNIFSLFNNSNNVSKEYIPKEIINLAYSFVNVQILKEIMQDNELSIENELVQTVYSYSLLNEGWNTHNLFKHPKCELCFSKNINENIFEVNL